MYGYCHCNTRFIGSSMLNGLVFVFGVIRVVCCRVSSSWEVRVILNMPLFLLVLMVRINTKDVIESSVANNVFFWVVGRGLVGDMCGLSGVNNQRLCI